MQRNKKLKEKIIALQEDIEKTVSNVTITSTLSQDFSYVVTVWVILFPCSQLELWTK